MENTGKRNDVNKSQVVEYNYQEAHDDKNNQSK